MRPTRGRVGRVTRAAEVRLERLIVLATPISAPLVPYDRRLLSFLAIEAANLWAQYSRCLYLSAAFGARDKTGTPAVTSPAASERAAIDQAVHALRPKLRGTTKRWTRQELPDFQNKGHLSKCLYYIGASVSPTVDAAVSYNSRVLNDLPTMRNFYAHKSREAQESASALGRHYGVTGRLEPAELLSTVPRGAGDILLREWLADLAAILKLMPA
jgi:hypothetical protein